MASAEQEALTFNPELQDVSRQRKLAELLMASGLQQPQGQMISGRYVAPSWTQMLNPMANILAGQAIGERADTEQLKIAQALKQQQMSEVENIMSAGSQEERIAATLKGNTPVSRNLLPKLLETYTKEPNWERTEINANGNIIKGVYDKRNPDVMATFRPYNESIDVPLAGARYSGAVPSGAQNTPLGMQNAPTGMQNAPLSIRNNNPGNLVAPSGQFQQFPTPEAGNTALINDLTLKLSGQSPAYKARFGDAPVTPARLAEVWSPAGAQGNSPESTKNYGNYIAQKLNISPNAPIPNNPQALARVAEGIAEFEVGAYGGKPATTKYDLEVPKQFNTPKERDEWFAKSREPLTGEPLKMVTGAENTIVALRDFNKGLQNFTRADLLNPDKSANMTGLAKNAYLALKDAKGLGVLNKEDLPQLEAIMRNPSDWKNILNSKELFQKLADRQIEFASKVVATNYKNSYKQIPEATKQKLTQIDAEVVERQKADVQKTLDKPLMYQSPDAVEAAGKAGRIKDGQLIIIGNQKFRYKKD
jgi:hypothetical protein